MRLKLIQISGLLLALPLSFGTSAQSGKTEPEIDISQLFNGFVLSSVAVNECEKPKEPYLSQFLENFQTVWITAAKEIEKRFPDKKKEEISAAMKKQTNLLTERVNEVVKLEGCDGEKIKQLIQGFYIYAKWTPQTK